MEFRFNVNPYFRENVIRVEQNMMPAGFKGDRRQAQDASQKMTEIINSIGEASARAQGLNKPVTTAQKLRNTDHSVYLMCDNVGKNGCVVGLLKVGKKNLYVFDPNGETKQVFAPCVLDFYVHESRQRSGLGKTLFESMLAEQKYNPSKMAIDRPSEKLLGFFNKHYGLKNTIPQMNNFVVYDSFFNDGTTQQEPSNDRSSKMNITDSPNTALFGPNGVSADWQARSSKHSSNESPGFAQIPGFQTSPMGRFGAPRPQCSMSESEKENVNFSDAQQCLTSDVNANKEDNMSTHSLHSHVSQRSHHSRQSNPNIQNTQNSQNSQNSATYPNYTWYNQNMCYPPTHLPSPMMYQPQPYVTIPNATPYWNPYYIPSAQYAPQQMTNNMASPSGADDVKSIQSEVQYEQQGQNIENEGLKTTQSSTCNDATTANPPTTQESQQFNQNVARWPPQGYICPPPMVQPIPVCRSCTQMMVPSWKCPNGHTKPPVMSYVDPIFPQMSRPMVIPPHSQGVRSRPTSQMNVNMSHPNMVPHPYMVCPPMWSQPQIIECPHPDHYPHGTAPGQPVTASSKMSVNNQNPLQAVASVHSDQCKAAQLQQNELQAQHERNYQNPDQGQSEKMVIDQGQGQLQPDQMSVHSEHIQPSPRPPSERSFQMNPSGRTPRQGYTISNIHEPIPENIIIQNSLEQQNYKNESQQRFLREFQEDLKNGVYSRRSNGLDPAYNPMTPRARASRTHPVEPGLSSIHLREKNEQMIIHNKAPQKSSEPNSAPFQKLGNDFKL